MLLFFALPVLKILDNLTWIYIWSKLQGVRKEKSISSRASTNKSSSSLINEFSRSPHSGRYIADEYVPFLFCCPRTGLQPSSPLPRSTVHLPWCTPSFRALNLSVWPNIYAMATSPLNGANLMLRLGLLVHSPITPDPLLSQPASTCRPPTSRLASSMVWLVRVTSSWQRSFSAAAFSNWAVRLCRCLSRSCQYKATMIYYYFIS